MGKEVRLGQHAQSAFENAISAFSDSLLDKLWVFAGAGTRSSELKLGADKDSDMLILQLHEHQELLVFTILKQVVQVQAPLIVLCRRRKRVYAHMTVPCQIAR